MRTTRKFWPERRFRDQNHVLNMCSGLKGHCFRSALSKTGNPFSHSASSITKRESAGPRPPARAPIGTFSWRPADGPSKRRAAEARTWSRSAPQRESDPLSRLPLEVPCRKSRRAAERSQPSSRLPLEVPCRKSGTRGRMSMDYTAVHRGAPSGLAFVLFRSTVTLCCLTLLVKTFSLPAGTAGACSI